MSRFQSTDCMMKRRAFIEVAVNLGAPSSHFTPVLPANGGTICSFQSMTPHVPMV